MGRRKNIFAICDGEEKYAVNFVEYANRRSNLPFEYQVFTSMESLGAFSKENRIELLLISETMATEAIGQMNIGQTVLLTEEGVHTGNVQWPAVYKYQSSDKVIREALSYYSASVPMESTQVSVKKKIIGIYSPVGRTAKTSFALTMGQLLAKDHPAIYLNMEEYAGFEQLLECNYEKNIGDLIYYIRQDEMNLSLKLSTMVHNMNNLDYIPPAMSPLDIQNTNIGEWMKLLDVIAEDSVYETVIMDIGDGVRDLYTLLNRCNLVYMPVRNDVMSQAKIRQFEELMKAWDYGGLLKRLRKIQLPYYRTQKKGKDYFDDLVWSQLGDYVRNLMRKDGML